MDNVHHASIWSPPPELLGISKQTWFGSDWNDTRPFHIREISAHCWAGRKRQCEICCGACGWACGTDPTLSHSHFNKLGHASVAFSEWALPLKSYTIISLCQLGKSSHAHLEDKQPPDYTVTMSINALHYHQCWTKTYLCSLSDSNSCSYSAVQDPSITSSFPLAGHLNESEVTDTTRIVTTATKKWQIYANQHPNAHFLNYS